MAKLIKAWIVGDKVATVFSGNETRHTITATIRGTSESGLLVRVEPRVPKTSNGKWTWLEANWFYSPSRESDKNHG